MIRRFFGPATLLSLAVCAPLSAQADTLGIRPGGVFPEACKVELRFSDGNGGSDPCWVTGDGTDEWQYCDVDPVTWSYRSKFQTKVTDDTLDACALADGLSNSELSVNGAETNFFQKQDGIGDGGVNAGAHTMGLGERETWTLTTVQQPISSDETVRFKVGFQDNWSAGRRTGDAAGPRGPCSRKRPPDHLDIDGDEVPDGCDQCAGGDDLGRGS